MTNLPRLELTEDPNKNNEYIIYRYPSKGIHIDKTTTENGVKDKKGKNTTGRRTRRRTNTKGRRTSAKGKGRRTRRKSFFNIF